MPHKRFLAIMAALQCYDYQTTNQNNPLNKVRPIYNLFHKSLSDLYYPYQFISVDERMVKSKARFFFKQYIMNKSVNWGFKLWTLACSVTGYTMDIQLAELNDTDRNLDGDIDLQGKSVAEVLCTLTRGAITRRHSASGRVEGGGLTVWHRRKQQTCHMPVSLTSRRICKVCSTVSKAKQAVEKQMLSVCLVTILLSVFSQSQVKLMP